MRIRFSLALLAVLPLALGAQASVTVPLQDPVYRDLDRLFGNGLVQTMIVGQRPYTRREIARIVLAASRKADSTTADPYTTRTLQRLSNQFAPELRALGDSNVTAHASFTDVRGELLGVSAARRAIPSRPVGSVEADVAPLLNGRAGRVFRDGLNAALEAGMEAEPGRALAFQFRPRVVVNQNAGQTFAEGEVQALSGLLLVRNIAIEAGRDQFVWGQGFGGGLLGSTSGRPLDMVRIFSDTASRAPWIFSHLGPMRGTLVFVDLGPNQRYPHSNIIAYKLSGNPITPRFEFSASVLSEQGGRGAPSASLRDHLIDIIPALQYTLPASNKSHDQISNKFAGWEYRFRIPEWSGLQLYAEHQFDDMDPRRWRSTLWEDGGHIVGASFARLGSARDVSAALEFHHTGLRYYEHGVFTSGVAFNRVLIGDPLGPQGNAGYLRLDWSRGGASEILFDLASERRSGDVYDAREDGVPPHETNFHFVLLQRGSAEWRNRATVSWSYRPSSDRRLVLESGYERVTNFGFVQASNRNAFLLNAALELYPGR